MALSGEEGLGTGDNWPPNKHALKKGAQENFLPPWKIVLDVV